MSAPIIDYDEIEVWMPWMTAAVEEIAPKNLARDLAAGDPEYIEDARDIVMGRIGKDRLLAHLNGRLAVYGVRVYHRHASDRERSGTGSCRGTRLSTH